MTWQGNIDSKDHDMSDKITGEQIAKAVGSLFGTVLVIFAAFISAIFSLAKKTK